MQATKKPTFAGAILRLLFACFLLGLLARGGYELASFGWRLLDYLR